MSKRVQLLVFVVVFAATSLAQVAQAQNKIYKSTQSVRATKAVEYMGDEPINSFQNSFQNTNAQRGPLCQGDPNCIGSSWYDLQSNYGMPSERFVVFPNGNMAGVWTRGEQAGVSAFPNRGTGYASFDGMAWSGDPTSRIETFRTGWPSLIMDANGTQHVFNHPNTGINVISNSGSGWSEATIPNNIGMLWPRAANSGDNIHVIALSNNGAPYEGMERALLYNRSTDNGATWDQVNVILPGMDSTVYGGIPADAYSIDAHGNTVAIAVFHRFADTRVYISNDNGTSWAATIVADFPVDGFTYIDEVDIDGDGIADLIDFDGDGNADTITVSDYAGDVIVDNAGNVHVAFGTLNIYDDTPGDGFYNLIYGSAIRYWTNSFGADSTQLVAGVIDENGDNSYNFPSSDSIGDYRSIAYASMPNLAIDNDDRIYLAYSAVSETAISSEQYYRHVLMSGFDSDSTDWTVPVDITMTFPNAIASTNPVVTPLVEAVYPVTHREVDTKIHLMTQEDFEPGLCISGDEDGCDENMMLYRAIDRSVIFPSLGTTSVNQIAAELGVKVFPNPTVGNLTVDLTAVNELADVQIINMLGQSVRTLNNQTGVLTLDVSNLANGIYFIRVNTETQFSSTKVIVSK